MSETRALILAAGRGSRLAGAGEGQPKALVRLAGHSLLEWKRRALAAAGIREVQVLTGYRAEAIAATGIETIHNERWAQTNMVATLLCADATLSQPGRTLVCYGDVVFHPDVVHAVLGASDDIVVPFDRHWLELWQARFDDPLSDAESFVQAQGWLVDIGRRVDRLEDIRGQFMGVLALSRDGWARVRTMLMSLRREEVDALDTTALLGGLIAARERIRAVAVEGRWCEVDTQSDLVRYEGLLRRTAWRHDWRWESRE